MNRMGNDNNSRIINDDDDDNGKNSKIQRDSRAFLTKALVIMGVLTVFALGLGIMHQEPKSAARSHHSVVSNNVNNEVSHRENNNKDTTNVIQALDNSGGKSHENIDTLLAATVNSLDGQVRARKKTPDVIMETDEDGLRLTSALQKATLKLLEHRYGANTRHTKFRIVVDVMYPASVIKDPDSDSHKGQFTIEMAPHDIIPCSVFYFMEMVRTFKSMDFHRNAGHVLQASSQSGATAGHKSMPFQEYSPLHPHAKYSTGYAGRPSGPEWYVSIQDNTNNHGPGSQQKKNPYEADSNFGNIVDGVERGVFAKIHSVPANGFLPKEHCTKMYKMTIMVNSINDPNQWAEWIPLSVIKD
jgi:hypothetical protein